MASSYTVIFALALFVEMTTCSAMALPKSKMDEERTDHDSLVSITGDGDMNESGQLTFRRHPIIEGRLVDEDGTKRIFILAAESSSRCYNYQCCNGTVGEDYGKDTVTRGEIESMDKRAHGDIVKIGKARHGKLCRNLTFLPCGAPYAGFAPVVWEQLWRGILRLPLDACCSDLLKHLQDTGIKGSPGREANLAFSSTFPVVQTHGTDHALDGFGLRDERRSVDDIIPVGRRDIDMLRCMIGRVYRPCWQA